ncbi:MULTISPECIES: sensor domain-containing diguanylate cyclase [Bradyrhizobium]|jgi:diguanylate cyclase (GGDEF)-like protein/PAS domain S-box-containing protein|uniref:diguanylate cyclase n=1 Tax=Bradyrhizobium ottawaense TaxID=931866 RepID=A0ABV4FY47_9BRAD|nr:MULTISPECIES: diguanylate cyclase [Bradyrhizobium]MBR1291896.1 diguanylate cyclase [Bradyrhizobium ottawaense]MDA9418815.1 diguanylate cyclase [Bradyrhizobium sp. CCBAU 25360]MDA9486107.1 diguanylate cyclase [Bradyrhizobium sp. CCBAU 11445]PDT68083.1 GGDEF domain-containing protein [Bradyrhizobium ottawaense]WLB48005.1 diguanylate cyclase [Bradyrhizobium ottawaense]
MSLATQRAGWSRLPLRAAAFVVLTCATILGVSGWREWAARDAVLRGAETEMANVARSLTQHAEDSLDLLDSGVVGVVSRLEMDGTAPATIAKLRTLLEVRKKAIERVHSLAIIDDQGNWLTSPGTIGSTLSDDAFFRYHQLSPKREPYVGRPVKSLLDGQWVVTLSRRFDKPDGSFGGVVLATISSKYLSHFYEQFEIGRNSSVSLTHGDGLIIARNPSNETFVGRSVSDKPLFRDASLQRPSGAYYFKSPLDGAERVSFFKRSSRFPLLLLATVDKDELLAPWRAAAISRMLYVVALVMLIAVIGAVLVRQLQRGQRMAAALVEKEAHFRLLAEGSSDMVTRIGLDERLRYVSPSSARVVGWRANQLIGTPALAGINPEDLPEVQAIVDAMKRGEREEARLTYRNSHRQNGEVWLESTMRVTRKDNGRVDGVVAISRDITEHKKLETRLETLAIEDSLTGLANRRRFDERLKEEWARAYRDRSSLALLMIDVDHFKAYNDEYGHPAGDACLRLVAKIIAAETQRAGDLAARYGGEEFAMLLPNTDAAGCALFGERIRSAIHKAGLVHATNLESGCVTASVGGATCRPALERTAGVASLVEAADRALYAAKDAGRDRLVMSGELMNLMPKASGQ